MFIDRGCSGKNLDRPQFQQLLGEIRGGTIRRVIVYRLDRISRSVLDFSNLIQCFQQYDVSFVSTVERFDTSSPIGKAMLMIVMVFAQLERETIQQRVTDAYRSRCRKGFYMGGRIPYGFRLAETTLQGKRTKRYLPCQEELDVVEALYQQYAQPEQSFSAVARWAEKAGIRNRSGVPFSRMAIRDILLSPLYARFDGALYRYFQSLGVELANPEEDFVGLWGGYLYTGSGNRSRSRPGPGQVLVLAPHEGIIHSALWLQCRRTCMDRQPAARPNRSPASWLTGLLQCSQCGSRLSWKHRSRKNGPDRRYLLCPRRGAGCGLPVLDADQVEAAVDACLREKLSALAASASPLDQTGHALRLEAIDREIADLLRQIPLASGSVMAYINQTVADLERQKESLSRVLSRWEENAHVLSPQAFSHWEELTLQERRAAAGCVLERVSVASDRLTLFWRL